jgi:phage-related protein
VVDQPLPNLSKFGDHLAMPIQIFDFRIVNKIDAQPEDRFVATDYGGYRQTSAAGLNSQVKRFSFSCIFLPAEATEANRLRSFVDVHRKITPFLWLPPGESAATKFQFDTYDYSVESKGIGPVVPLEWRWNFRIRSSFNP